MEINKDIDQTVMGCRRKEGRGRTTWMNRVAGTMDAAVNANMFMDRGRNQGLT